ncbi:MAG: transcription-repair coupling factor, partial [Deltaproteobacteria bacterium]|nr:transcription-repair coupling factor [Deltaproteobacteria bacterium]
MLQAPLAAITARLGEEKELEIHGLRGSALALLLARLAVASGRSLVVVSEEYQQSLELRRDVAAYLQLLSAGERPPVLLNFPPLQRLPYRQVLPLITLEQARIATLYRLRQEKHYLLFTSITALADRLAPPELFFRRFFTLEWGEAIDREELVERLAANGYLRVPTVDEPGDYSLRGSILDLFSPLYDQPIRLDFFGDEIESLRHFDPVSQRSRKEELERVTIAPAHEILLPANREAVKERLKARFVELNNSRLDMGGIYRRLQREPHFPGIDALLPAVYPAWADLRDYLDEAGLPVLVEPARLDDKLQNLQQMLADAHEKAAARQQFTYPPTAFLAPVAASRDFFVGRQQLLVGGEAAGPPAAAAAIEINSRDNRDLRDALRLAAASQEERLFAPAAAIIQGWLRQGQRIILCGRSRASGERLQRLLADYELPCASDDEQLHPGKINLRQLSLGQGTRLVDERLVIITESDIFGAKKKGRRPSRPGSGRQQFYDDFSALKTGDYITHIDYGIGIYRGLQTMEVEGIVNDYLVLEYQDRDLVYVPVDRFNLIHAYHGTGDQPPRLTKLGGSQWERSKAKARQAIDDFLVELVDLYASRQVENGHAYPPPDRVYGEFEAGFPYEETPDQRQAIDEVIADLQAARPMDRLICGDVGYGKTEVAIRAVFLVVNSGRQAAILVPTTILAQQHYHTFRERFASHPIEVAVLSRFKSPAEQQEIIRRLREGKVDVLIGTHRLLQKDVVFKNLGLLVLDEEHKFGVRHKERLTTLKKNIDVLSMSATPIPRTLQMSLSGLRTLSAITTAPRDRLAVRTYVAAYDDEIIREAVTKELGRGGQVFFVHNEVTTIEAMANHLRALLPTVRLAVAHGQMPPAALEKVMLAFANHETDLLLCSTIIESGLDIPNANTLIINKAHRFGLAQLYQLRGRVGRAQKKAYAYLLVPSLDQLSYDARRRLTALAEASELGSGFRIAMQDLEIRGAGNLLGKKQSGHISAIG